LGLLTAAPWSTLGFLCSLPINQRSNPSAGSSRAKGASRPGSRIALRELISRVKIKGKLFFSPSLGNRRRFDLNEPQARLQAENAFGILIQIENKSCLRQKPVGILTRCNRNPVPCSAQPKKRANLRILT